jgi:hypothetical protein
MGEFALSEMQEQDDEIDLSAALGMNAPPAKKVCQ